METRIQALAPSSQAVHLTTIDDRFPYLPWTTTDALNDVELREWGDGHPIVVVPGMTGGGQATLQFATRVATRAHAAGRPHRLILVEFSKENHSSLEALQSTVVELLKKRLGREPCTVWTQSFGNLVAPAITLDRELAVSKRVMLSPFTRLPAFKTNLGLFLMAVSPAFLYRATIKPLGRFVFGPTGNQPNHIFYHALAAGGVDVARRRTRWLKGRDFSSWFSALEVPTQIWLGRCDRLVDIKQQEAFFRRLTSEKANVHLSMIDGTGHVVSDTAAVERITPELQAWVTAS